MSLSRINYTDSLSLPNISSLSLYSTLQTLELSDEKIEDPPSLRFPNSPYLSRNQMALYYPAPRTLEDLYCKPRKMPEPKTYSKKSDHEAYFYHAPKKVIMAMPCKLRDPLSLSVYNQLPPYQPSKVPLSPFSKSSPSPINKSLESEDCQEIGCKIFQKLPRKILSVKLKHHTR